MLAEWLGRLAFVLALLAFALAFRAKYQAARTSSILLCTAIMVGTLNTVLPLSRLEVDGTAVASLVLSVVVLSRLIRLQRT